MKRYEHNNNTNTDLDIFCHPCLVSKETCQYSTSYMVILSSDQ